MKRNTKNMRTGTAVVELALCLPVIFTIVFASIEACNMIALKQIIAESAYDGALVASNPDANESDVISSINTVLAARNVTPQSVSVEGDGGASYASLVHGDSLTVTVQVLADGNVVGPQLFSASKTLSVQAVAIKQ